MSELAKHEFAFENVDDLINYLYNQYGELTPIKLQKGLYFLYAYYGATYGKTRESEGVLEQDFADFPDSLFDAQFEAWTYGPVIKDVWAKQKAGFYGNDTPNIQNIKREIILFIDELFEQINSVSDFSLVDRSHEDEAWIDAYNSGATTKIMNNNDLIEEYKRKYLH